MPYGANPTGGRSPGRICDNGEVAGSVAIGGKLAGRIVPGVLCALLLLAACGTKSGQPTPDAVVAEYVAALRAADSGRLARIADPDDDSSAEIAHRLQTLGDGRLSVTLTRLHDTESDHMKSVTVQGTLDGSPYSEELWLHLRGERWYVLLGPNRNARPKQVRSS